MKAVQDSGPCGSAKREEGLLTVIAVGASSGGLEAFQAILPQLPMVDQVCYLLLQHRDPTVPSRALELLAERSRLPVKEPVSGEQLTSGVVYWAGAEHDMRVVNGAFSLEPRNSSPSPSIDLLFSSLAQDSSLIPVAVILTGQGDDGCRGARDLAEGGSWVFVQDPREARFPSMPEAGLTTVPTAIVFTLEKFGEVLLRHLTERSGGVPEEDDSLFSEILTRLSLSTGWDLHEYKTSTLLRRIRRRQVMRHAANLSEYLACLDSDPSELNELASDVLISVTQFFRDAEAFAVFSQELRALAKKKRPDEPIRIWVPACATGEEVYSIAIVADEVLAGEQRFLQIFGTDIDEGAVAFARRGCYEKARLANVDPRTVARHFVESELHFQVGKSLRDRIVFARQDLVKDPPFSRMDVIACRNLLIYLSSDLQRRIIPMFHYALVRGGILFLGRSESVGPFTDLFQPLDKQWRIYRRMDTLGSHLPPPRRGVPGPVRPVASECRGLVRQSLREVLASGFLDAFPWPIVLLDEHWNLLHVRGDVTAYLRLGEGDAHLNVLDLAHETLRSSLHIALNRARRERTIVRLRELVVQAPGGARLLHLSVNPHCGVLQGQGTFLVVFQEEELLSPSVSERPVGTEAQELRITELERELAALRAHLQTNMEEIESANEDLQSLNEELQSANEELQSSNEELETANEELQATNEELTTVNEELHLKTNELANLNSDLENILRRMGLAMIVVDADLRVTRFTAPATALFNLMVGDRGQTLTSIASHVELPNLRENLLHVLQTGQTLERPVDMGPRFFEMRIFPYYNDHNRITGAILTFYDNSAIHRREEEFRALAENSPDFVVRALQDGKIVYVNKAFEQIVGRSREYLVGALPRDLGFAGDLGRHFADNLLKTFSCGQETTFELRMPTAFGERYFQARAVPERTLGGRITSVLCIGRDLTALDQGKQALLRSEYLHRRLLETAQEGVWETDSAARTTYVNQRFCEMFGYAVKELVGLAAAELQQLLELPASMLSEHSREALQVEVALRRKDGTRVWVIASSTPILEPNGRFAGAFTLFTDLSRQKAIEEALRSTSQNFASLLESMNDGFLALDESLVVMFFNAAAGRLLGRRVEDVVGRHFFDAFPEMRSSVFEERFLHALRARKPLAFETYFPNAPYENWFDLRVYPWEHGISVFFQVVTERKHAEEQKARLEAQLRQAQRLEAVGALAGGIAHDFNNILSAIFGLGEIALEKAGCREDNTREIERILSAGERATVLVKKILTFSRRTEPVFALVNLNDTVRSVLALLERTIPKMIILDTRLAPDLLDVMADSSQLEQVIINLVSNAVDAIPESGRICLRTRNCEWEQPEEAPSPELAPGSYVVLAVEDDGPGMEPQIQKRMYDPFFTTKEVGRGTGLGLSIVFGAVRSHGGVITCESSPGGGTRFEVFLKAVPHQAVAPSPEQDVSTAWQGGGETVLVVDDEATLLDVTKSFLSGMGYRVLAACSGEEAIAIHEETGGAPDIVVLDLGMPGMGGARCLKELRLRAPRLPIVVASGYGELANLPGPVPDEWMVFLPKPYKRHDLLQCMRRLLNASRHRAES